MVWGGGPWGAARWGGDAALLSPFQNGLMVACYKGFVDIVPLLQKCPYLNVNQQDKDGNTALMMAAQAGRHLAGPARPLKVL